MLTLISILMLAPQAATPAPRICDQVHLWTTPAEAEAVRKCEAERPPEDRLRREQAAQPGRAAGQSNDPEHRAVRVHAMNGRCAEALAGAAAIGDVPLSDWVAQRCGAAPTAAPPRPARPSEPAPTAPHVNLWD